MRLRRVLFIGSSSPAISVVTECLVLDHKNLMYLHYLRILQGSEKPQMDLLCGQKSVFNYYSDIPCPMLGKVK